MLKKIIRKIRNNPTYCYYFKINRLVNNGSFYEYCKKSSSKKYPRLLKAFYYNETGEILDLNGPKSFNEKIQWLKLYDSTPLKTKLADKYAVREWVKEKIGNDYLVPLLGNWNSFDEIDFNLLPKQFVLKVNSGSGWNMIVKNKIDFDRIEAKQKFDIWMNTNFAFVNGLELQYKDIKPMILAEQYIEEMDGNLLDYKIHCFNGEPKIIQVIGDRDLINHKAKEAFFDVNWQRYNFLYHTYDNYDISLKKPDNISEMLDVAKRLSKDFKYVRVDLYNFNHKIFFGEMTFTPASGVRKWDKEYNQLLGSWISID